MFPRGGASVAGMKVLVNFVMTSLLLNQAAATLQDNMVNVDDYKVAGQATGGQEEGMSWLEAGGPESQVAKSRVRRFIPFPTGSLVNLEFTLTIPVDGFSDVGEVETIADFTFFLPNDTISWARNYQHSASDRINVYHRMEKFLNRMGYNGHACTLRTLCEIAESPFEHSLYGEVVNLVLSASGSPDDQSVYDEYRTAEYYGKTHGQCDQLYPGCPTSVLDKISQAFTF
ncbi:uncharacterized protein LOC121880073 [Homarus americanus]|uniref:Putative DM4/DM12 family-like protein 28 n=1 Tax=Homarus americanus TaxID=6706 RepID=A0A8J5JKW3_HOMAM|nr:uncharacterized protein LOC121880073 [Homarus americanus]KAG7157345.1 putative DM4/DM12 family-like protein 28 [Homarus americanus]